MTTDGTPTGGKTQSRRQVLMKPFQVIAISAVCGLFVFGIILLALRNPVLALIGAGVTMVLVLMVLALLLLGYKPNPDVPVYLDRDLYESDEPGAKDAAFRVDPSAHGQKLPRETDEPTGN